MARTSKYKALGAYLRKQTEDNVVVSFAALAGIVGGELPPSAHKPTWWANSATSSHARNWLGAGYRVGTFREDAVEFVRLGSDGTVLEKRRASKAPAAKKTGKKRGRPAKAKTEKVVAEKAADLRVAVIGTGNMGAAILAGLRKTGRISLKLFRLYDSDLAKSTALAKSLKTTVVETVADAIANADIVLIAVKPNAVPDVLDEISEVVIENHALVISVAAGWSIEGLENLLPIGTAVARIMPNLNAAVAQSATVYCVNDYVNALQSDVLKKFLSAFGFAQEIDETRFNAHLALSGAGPAFVYLFADALARAGVRLGLPRAEAQNAASQTLLGSATNLLISGVHPQELVDRVCSPGGITIEGVLALEETCFAASVAAAVTAAHEKNLSL
ncbi:MAG: pyrroline-5-carboxylate reductase [Oscillospiraceae bacterium]|jgi:pyrroline-5-carboxylate reductase|nr:pyrroline-5-carboxylate reductase [Oscillospiraceae bacterium]